MKIKQPFRWIILTRPLEELIMPKMKIITKPKNSNSSCKCGRILMAGQTVGACGHDNLGRPNVICMNCRNK